jgi:hypothetical protein
MPKTCKERKSLHTCKSVNSGLGWEALILETQRLVVENKNRGAKLRAALKTFTERLAQGAPFPSLERGEEKEKPLRGRNGLG